MIFWNSKSNETIIFKIKKEGNLKREKYSFHSSQIWMTMMTTKPMTANVSIKKIKIMHTIGTIKTKTYFLHFVANF